jgi:vacuolar-type H+-ATPase subunit I/STV1
MSNIQNIQTPEMAAWVQSVVSPMVQEIVRQEIREDGGGRLERRLNAHQYHAERRFDRLETALAELAESQKRTDKRFEELAEAQERTEERLDRLGTVVAELAEAQKRTEARVEELAEAQKRTEVVVTNLVATQKDLVATQKNLVVNQQRIIGRLDDLDHRMGLVTNVLGLEAEGEAEEVLVYVLEQKGYRLLESPYALAVDDTEIDIVVRVETPDGEQVTVLAEVKARARLKGLRRWSGRLRNPTFQQLLTDAGVTRPLLPYFFGLRVYQVVDEEAGRLGVGVLDPNGERVTPALLQ